MRQQKNSELFTAAGVAEFCQVDLKTIHNWADKGEIRHFRTPGRHLRFRRADVIELLRKYGFPIPDALRVGARPSVVVLHEDQGELDAVKGALAPHFEVTTFTNPIQALLFIGAEPPDALVLDAPLPDVDALGMVKAIKANKASEHVRCVVYSVHGQKREAAKEAGAVFVPEGSLAVLLSTLGKMLGVDTANTTMAPKAAE